MLKSWRELVYGILYHDQCSPQYGNSTNLFAEEIDRNIQHLRTHGFDLQDQRQELTQQYQTTPGTRAADTFQSSERSRV